MMESRDYLEMTLKAIDMFAHDGKITAAELGELLKIAERDGKIDSNEIRVLTNVITKIQSHELSDDMKAKLAEISQKISV